MNIDTLEYMFIISFTLIWYNDGVHLQIAIWATIIFGIVILFKYILNYLSCKDLKND